MLAGMHQGAIHKLTEFIAEDHLVCELLSSKKLLGIT